MDTASQRIELGRQFAAALDACDYARAAGFLADDCRYKCPEEEAIVGPQAICESYRECDLLARRNFSSVTYRSEAAVDASGGIRLTFFDELECGGARHTFRCSQIVYFDENGMIVQIELVDIPGERERLREFCASHRVQLR